MKHIVVLGGGAGGLELVTKLGHKFGRRGKAKITLIDRSQTHIWKPLLHEMATGSIDINSDGINYRVHSTKHHYTFKLGTVFDVDPDNKVIRLEPISDERGIEVLPVREVQYDMLVLAVGSVSNDFGTPGVADHCYYLDSHRQAERFQQALLTQFLRIHQLGGDQRLNIAIVGGGATGVELSAELFHMADLLKAYGMPEISAQKVDVQLVEAGERILPALPERIAKNAKQELEALGVSIHEATKITEARQEGLVTESGEVLEADLMIWAAGVKAPEFIANIEQLETNRNNQVVVKSTLQSTHYEDVYVIGDCCACKQEDGSMVPPRAQSAHQMADLVFANIEASFKGEALKDYVYKDYGSLVSLSKYSTVGSLMGNLMKGSMFIEGRLARFVYISLYRLHLIAIHGWFKAMIIMAAQRIGKVVKPKLKLH